MRQVSYTGNLTDPNSTVGCQEGAYVYSTMSGRTGSARGPRD
jgi:hypothetical protein